VCREERLFHAAKKIIVSYCAFSITGFTKNIQPQINTDEHGNLKIFDRINRIKNFSFLTIFKSSG
jgi:hypothetical protein